MKWLLIFLVFSCVSLAIGEDILVEPVFQTGHYSKVTALKFHSDNQHLVSCGDDGQLIVWDVLLGLQRKSILAHQNGVRSFEFFNDSVIVTLGNSSEIKFWSFPALVLVKELELNKDPIEALEIINDSTICFVGNRIYIHDVWHNKTNELGHESKGVFTTISYHKKRNEIAVAGPTDNYCVTISLTEPPKYKKYVLGNIHKVSYASDNRLLLTNTEGALQYVYLDQDKKYTFSLTDNLNYVTGMDQLNNEIAVSTAFGFASIFNDEKHEVLTQVGLNGVALTSLDYSNDGKWLAVANNNGVIYLFEAENYKLNKVLKGASASIVDTQIYGDNLFIGYSDGVIRQIHLPTNKIRSNSIKLDLFQEQSGINYTIFSIDGFTNNQLEFTVLKTDRHHEKTSLLKSAKKYKSYWNLDDNELILTKSIDDKELKKRVNFHFVNNIPFQLRQYSKQKLNYQEFESRFQINPNQNNFYKLSGKDTVCYPTKHSAPISGLRFFKQHNLIISFSQDGSIRFWNNDGDYIAVLFLSGQYSFIYMNEADFYFASKEILDKIGFLYKGKLFSFEQYDIFYNRPNEVMNGLLFFDKDEIRAYEKAYHKRLEKLDIKNNNLNIVESLPQIEVQYRGDYSTKEDVISFNLEMSDPELNLKAYSYRINGIENRFEMPKVGTEFSTELSIKLGAGINQIEFFCSNEEGVKSMIVKKNITCEKQFEKPNLYIVSIGVSKYENQEYNLAYAEKDANDIAATLQGSKKYNQILEKRFINNDFTSESRNEIETFLENADINDVIVFFYAGHGILDEKLDYYLATHNINFNKPAEKGVSFDAVEGFFEKLVCRNKLILIDACFSGELDKTAVKVDTSRVESEENITFRNTSAPLVYGSGEMGVFELSKRTFADLRMSRGTNILSSASGIEYAIEGDKWGNGLFTFVLKDALLNKAADLNGDKQIRIMELQIYLRETVSRLSNGKQNPILRRENIKNNFVIW